MTTTPPGEHGRRLGLGGVRWPTLEDEPPLVLVPLGSLEQHGPHLPLATDSMVACAATRAVARRLAAAGVRVLVAPTLAYGASGEHEDFPGTISIGHEALWLQLVELGRSACRWARGLVLVNGHGGNVATVVDAVTRLRDEGRPVAWTGCALAGDAHAGRTETSLLRHLSPWSVRVDLAEVGATEPIEELMPRLRGVGVRTVSPNGILGDATGSTAEEGRRLFEDLVERLFREISLLDVGDEGRLRSARPAGARR
ncbi:mycofactocin biosynthesis peptidyl-dipeptidase MftE [Nocardioides currus]|uniref:Mycofactocin biosynthesis peptidyl-dipeptidase MftE n=1 Tax=Nocardioides currus TaxID=2133958 RepID=A0A2R7YZ04_9ACTN|nr:mycofactocin biosynthesis peptidyl-dipeptidase MftE [Nocardioides currus]PUA81627.1 mycofactocin biosynthesis peptidyl-dipeptidase MftE [Nocardioides currus]